MSGEILLSSGEDCLLWLFPFQKFVHACVDKILAYDNLSPLGINELSFFFCWIRMR